MNSQLRTVRRLPLWARWALAIVVAMAVTAGIAIAIDRAGPPPSESEAGAEAEVTRAADIAIAEDEAPHLASLSPGSASASALEGAIARDIHRRIADGQLTGPLQSVACRAVGAGSAGREPYRCTVRSAGIAYPFLAVVDERRQRLAWCKVDRPPVVDGPEIPISASCRA